MNEALKAAISDRIDMGYREDDILRELEESGYPPALSAAAVEKVVEEKLSLLGDDVSSDSELVEREVEDERDTPPQTEEEDHGVDSPKSPEVDQAGASGFDQWTEPEDDAEAPKTPEVKQEASALSANESTHHTAADDERWTVSSATKDTLPMRELVLPPVQSERAALRQKDRADDDVKEAASVLSGKDSDSDAEESDGDVGDSTLPPVPRHPTASIGSDETGIAVTEHKAGHRLRRFLVWLIIVLLLSGLVGAVAYGAYTGRLTQFFAPLFTSAPYEDESSLLAGLLQSGVGLDSYSFDLDHQTVLEPRQTGTPMVSNKLFDQAELDLLAEQLSAGPAEAGVGMSISGVVEGGISQTPVSDISFNAALDADPMDLSLAGKLRSVDGSMYMQFSEVPSTVSALWPDLPLSTWIRVSSMDTVSLVPQVFPSVPALELVMGAVPAWGTVEQLAAQSIETVPLLARQTRTDPVYYQAAQLGLVSPDDLRLSEEEQALLVRSRELLAQYPPITIISVEQRTVGEEIIYRYTVDINAQHLQLYLESILSEGTSLLDERGVPSMTELRSELQELALFIEDLNRWSTIWIDVRADGGFAGFEIAGAVTANHPNINTQLRFSSGATIEALEEKRSISAPEEVHPQTLEELFSASIQTEPVVMPEVSGDATAVADALTRFRVGAAQYRSTEGTYESVCRAPVIAEVLIDAEESNPTLFPTVYDMPSDALSITCNDTAAGYAVVVPLSSEAVWCLDSSGFFGPAEPLFALDKATDVSCE